MNPGERKRPVDVLVATTENIRLAGLPVIDGVQIEPDDLILARRQTHAHENGVYLASKDAWQRTIATRTVKVKRGVYSERVLYVQTEDGVWKILTEADTDES